MNCTLFKLSPERCLEYLLLGITASATVYGLLALSG